MRRVKYLYIRFDHRLFPYEVPRFRGAVIEKTRRASDWFHNHRDDNGYLYRYPRIQYKVTWKKATIVCLEEGVDEIHHLFRHDDLSMAIGHTVADMQIEHVRAHWHTLGLWDSLRTYSLLNWLALNQEHYQRYRQLEGNLVARIRLLEDILRGNILAFAKSLDWHLDQRLEVHISKINEVKYLKYKGQYLLAFTLLFQTNTALPDFIGLGKGASTGFGLVKGVRGERVNTKKQRYGLVTDFKA